jgi:hypothetical protein
MSKVKKFMSSFEQETEKRYFELRVTFVEYALRAYSTAYLNLNIFFSNFRFIITQANMTWDLDIIFNEYISIKMRSHCTQA